MYICTIRCEVCVPHKKGERKYVFGENLLEFSKTVDDEHDRSIVCPGKGFHFRSSSLGSRSSKVDRYGEMPV